MSVDKIIGYVLFGFMMLVYLLLVGMIAAELTGLKEKSDTVKNWNMYSE